MANSQAAKIPTLIVDDQDDIRLLLRMVIDRANHGLHVVGEASSGSEALAAIDALNPMVVIMDEMMPGMTGLDTMSELRDRRPHQIVIICSAYLDDAIIAHARSVGASGWLPKDQIRALPELILNLVMASRQGLNGESN